MMTIDTILDAIDALTAYEDEKRASLLYYDESDTDITIPALKALAAELKELREFVGVLRKVDIKTARGSWVIGSWVIDGSCSFYDANWDAIATGTDPFDAWQKMKAGEGE